MKIVVADGNLVPHHERFEAAMPGARVCWQANGVSPDNLRDADVYVGSRFTAAMADTAEKLKLIHVAGAGTGRMPCAVRTVPLPTLSGEHTMRSACSHSSANTAPTMSTMESMAPTSCSCTSSTAI